MELIGNSEAFPILRNWDFFNHAGVSPLPAVAARAMQEFADRAQTAAYLDSQWYADLERLRALVASLINAHPDEIAFVKNTSEGIATVANGISWCPGDRIVTTAVEYPANMYPWIDVSRRYGAELVAVPEETGPDGAQRVPLEQILQETAHPRTRLVALSHVEYASGQRHDLAAIGRLCRSMGKLLAVDAIQSFGAIPIDVQAMNIDFLSAGSQKWMLGTEGAGVLFCRREHLQQMRPLIMGWMNVVNAEDYGRYDLTLKSDARRFECGGHNVAGLLAMKASLELLAGVGIDRVESRLRLITDRLVERLTSRGYQVISPRGPGEFSGIVSFVSTVHDPLAILRWLRKEYRIEIAVRQGRLRSSPHFYNTEQQMDRLAEALPAH